MAIQAARPRRLFTVDEYHRMAEAGVFGPEERVELIEGEILELAVEVADTTVRFDRLVNARLYSRAAIPEFWLFLAQNCEVEVYRAPGADGYAQVTSLGGAAGVSPLAFPDVQFAVPDFFA